MIVWKGIIIINRIFAILLVSTNSIGTWYRYLLKERRNLEEYFSNITEKVEKHEIGGGKYQDILSHKRFFVLVDFLKLLGCKSHENGELLCSEMDILYYIL